jgi:urease accessory protein
VLFPGSGRIEVIRRGERSVVTRVAAASPLRLLTPRNHGHAAWIYASTFGGGLVGGDAVAIDVVVGEGASVMLSTQASTKVYRSSMGTSSELDAVVGSGGLLALLPDPVVCFAASRYRQRQRVRLEDGAGLVMVDWMSSGRHGAGERWRFDGYASRLEVERDGRLVMLDAVSLDAESGELDARMGRFNVLCALALIGDRARDCVTLALSLAASLPVEKGGRLLTGASPIGADGCVVRFAGVTVEDVAPAVRRYLAALPVMLGDDPWARKW